MIPMAVVQESGPGGTKQIIFTDKIVRVEVIPG